MCLCGVLCYIYTNEYSTELSKFSKLLLKCVSEI